MTFLATTAIAAPQRAFVDMWRSTRGAVAFSPSSIAGLGLWLDASDASTMTITNTDKVSQWRDKSGNGRHANQSVTNRQPRLATNTLVFTASATTMLITNAPNLSSGLAGITAYSVNYQNAGDKYMLHIRHPNAPSNIRFALVRPSGYRGIYYAKTNESLSTIFYSASGMNNTSMVVHAGVVNYAGTSVVNSIDGVSSNRFASFAAGVSDTRNESYTVIGNYDNDTPGGFSLDGHIEEILVYQTAHDTDTRQKIEGYLAWKWSIQSRLPTNHPYKASAP